MPRALLCGNGVLFKPAETTPGVAAPVAAAVAGRGIRVQAELGGKNAVVVHTA